MQESERLVPAGFPLLEVGDPTDLEARIEVLLDASVPHQNYIEDCQVCCRPIELDVTVGHDGEPLVVVTHENE